MQKVEFSKSNIEGEYLAKYHQYDDNRHNHSHQGEPKSGLGFFVVTKNTITLSGVLNHRLMTPGVQRYWSIESIELLSEAR